MADYYGKRVVITGGTSGIGLATAKRLVDGGARVLVTGRGEEFLAKAQAELGDRGVALRSDTSVLADVDELAARAREEFTEVDLLFVNAGITVPAPLGDVTEGEFERVFEINTKGPYFTVQRFAPLLAEGGSVVLTTSVVNRKGIAGRSVYAASKAALRSMSRTLAREMIPHGVRVNAVMPGPIDTGILDRTVGGEKAEQMKAQMKATNPMGRFGDPAEVVSAVLYLAFDATYTTGAELPVDGGASQL
ncbi:SDR family oxidoreductase [Lentzea sp. NPDC059081]|uniref:SDR family oxidoreductase n=1 Tax=Lentzea sp. NPDC059081 TaxID=3346719 RepID=UPI0036B8922A